MGILGLKFAFGILGLASVAAGFIYGFQQLLIFHPEKTSKDYRYATRFPSEELFFEFEGLKIHSLLVEPSHSRGVLLYFHGNAGSLERWAEVADDVAELTGWSVWIYDYPGFGKSDGSIESESQMIGIAEKFIEFARAKFPAAGQRFALYGRSVGSGLAVNLASRNKIEALVLETPYYSLEREIQFVAPWAPTWLIRFKVPSNEWFPAVQAPILVLHGTHDALIPYDQGRDLSQLNPRCRLVTIPRGEHSNLDQFPEYRSGVQAFFSEI